MAASGGGGSVMGECKHSPEAKQRVALLADFSSAILAEMAHLMVKLGEIHGLDTSRLEKLLKLG